MSDTIDQRYLLNKQYHSAVNLDARIRLHERFSTNRTDWQRWVFEQFDIPDGSRVLELGTGSGQLWVHNLDRIPESWQITLSDFSEGMLQDARKNLGEKAERFQFQVIDIQAIPFPNDTFDDVIANHMLYHVPDRQRAFAEIQRVLRPRGCFYAATNGEAHLREIEHFSTRAGIAAGGIMGAQARSVFNLQNGREQMAPWFSQIETRLFEGNLAVSEVEPLVAFILSGRAPESVSEEQLRSLRALLTEELNARGIIHIAKETGLFIASDVQH
ncbi:class I SAM-dependent methyltransferase [Dictyobacter aurantiacus]|uniref:Methyltransferase type 11 domain-containing protein n=1 Tax=Dictyobacter aurantiacus TaxID=1936993 RepID=A0A401ZLJ5_9CHLR|nr:class I SAM-dependent methyltransferase [Dictyobacter aurantiacus]GCE07723.1 hypothetical protein KDAU_50520 [Dictyobacter aurantiacus]